MDEINTLESLGFVMPTPAYLIGAILFSIIGYAAYRYGKKAEEDSTRWIGLVLMLFPYAVSETWMMYLVGIGLIAGLFMARR